MSVSNPNTGAAAFILTKPPQEVLMAIEGAAVYKAKHRMSVLILQGIMGGIFVALACHTAVSVGGAVPNLAKDYPGLQKLIFAAVFPVGLFIIILTGTELFTGDAMVMTAAIFAKKVSWKDLTRVWVTIWVTNYIGIMLFLIFLVYIPNLYGAEPNHTFITAMAVRKTHLGWGNAFLLAIGANMAVCLAIFQAICSADVLSKIVAAWWPIFAFACDGFEHSIANMYFLSAGAMFGADVNAFDILIMNLLPVTLGNIVGGGILVGAVFWWMYDKMAPHPTAEGLRRSASMSNLNIAAFQQALNAALPPPGASGSAAAPIAPAEPPANMRANPLLVPTEHAGASLLSSDVHAAGVAEHHDVPVQIQIPTPATASSASSGPSSS